MAIADEGSLLQFFEHIVPAERWRELEGGTRPAQIYSLPVVVWMMLLQRLDERGSQQEVVHQVALGKLGRFLPDSKRVREEKVSAATGAYARACGRVRIEVLERVCDELLRELGQRIESAPERGLPVLLIDGSSISLEHGAEVRKAFPAGRNQHGEAHWGILKWVVLHDVHTGIALRPAWGPMYGPEAVSEQQLAEQVLGQAPTRSVILGDGSFGVFSFAYAVAQSQRAGIFRLTPQRAKALGATALLPQGETKLCWRPSRRDRSRHPELPADAHVEGRLVAVTGKGFRETLYLFTTLPGAWEEIVALYAERWQVELDLRTLKRTLRLHHLRGKSRAAIEKELLIAVVAYALVRAFMATAARRVALPPRRLSFTRAYGLLNTVLEDLCSTVPPQRTHAYERVLTYMSKAKLPQRSHPRSYPRAVWGFRQDFPQRKSPHTEEPK
jgi:putative transposase